MRVLAGDIGGTKTRLGVFEVDGWVLQSTAEATYSSKQYDSLEAVIERFLGDHKVSFRRVCLGIAGPILAGKCKTTNLPWMVDAKRLAVQLRLPEVSLINDLEAIAYGIEALHGDDLFVLSEDHPDAQGNRAVIAAGTGLGEAATCWNGMNHFPFATEGGHTDFSPNNELEIGLLRFLGQKFEHVSWERVLCGPGLVNIYQYLLSHYRTSTPGWLKQELKTGDAPAVISQAAMTGRCELCSQALDLFVHLYGVEAGNLALKVMAKGGIYLGGGIAPKILSRLKAPMFMAAFRAKGRMKSLLKTIPVKVILNDRVALYGPAIYCAR